jgi:hypothetical protein
MEAEGPKEIVVKENEMGYRNHAAKGESHATKRP